MIMVVLMLVVMIMMVLMLVIVMMIVIMVVAAALALLMMMSAFRAHNLSEKFLFQRLARFHCRQNLRPVKLRDRSRDKRSFLIQLS